MAVISNARKRLLNRVRFQSLTEKREGQPPPPLPPPQKKNNKKHQNQKKKKNPQKHEKKAVKKWQEEKTEDKNETDAQIEKKNGGIKDTKMTENKKDKIA